jgi:type 1 glutamine amidotransferase
VKPILALHPWLLLLAASALATQLPNLVCAADTGPVKISLVWTPPDHPYSMHMYEHECHLLAHCLEQMKGVEPSLSQEWPDDKQLENVRAIVFYCRPAGDIVLDPKHREKFEQLMKSGVGLVAIHWATGADVKNGDEYSKYLGGWFNFAHAFLKIDKLTLQQVDPESPICNGWKPYDLHDEFYCNMKFHNLMKPVLKVNVDGKDQIVAWVVDRPDSHDGRSFGTTLGHFHENYGIPDFRKALVNGILWAAHVEVPRNGAPVEVTENELTLPPQK